MYEGSCGEILEGIQGFSYDNERIRELVPKNSGRALNREYKERLVQKVMARAFAKSFLPPPVRAVYTAVRSIRYLLKGIRCLLRGKLEVEALDATAIAVSVLRRDFDTAMAMASSASTSSFPQSRQRIPFSKIGRAHV